MDVRIVDRYDAISLSAVGPSGVKCNRDTDLCCGFDGMDNFDIFPITKVDNLCIGLERNTKSVDFVIQLQSLICMNSK